MLSRCKVVVVVGQHLKRESEKLVQRTAGKNKTQLITHISTQQTTNQQAKSSNTNSTTNLFDSSSLRAFVVVVVARRQIVVAVHHPVALSMTLARIVSFVDVVVVVGVVVVVVAQCAQFELIQMLRGLVRKANKIYSDELVSLLFCCVGFVSYISNCFDNDCWHCRQQQIRIEKLILITTAKEDRLVFCFFTISNIHCNTVLDTLWFCFCW